MSYGLTYPHATSTFVGNPSNSRFTDQVVSPQRIKFYFPKAQNTLFNKEEIRVKGY